MISVVFSGYIFIIIYRYLPIKIKYEFLSSNPLPQRVSIIYYNVEIILVDFLKESIIKIIHNRISLIVSTGGKKYKPEKDYKSIVESIYLIYHKSFVDYSHSVNALSATM